VLGTLRLFEGFAGLKLSVRMDFRKRPFGPSELYLGWISGKGRWGLLELCLGWIVVRGR